MSGFTDLEQQIIKYGFFRQQKRMEEAEESFQKIRATINAAASENREQEGYPGIAHDLETMRTALRNLLVQYEGVYDCVDNAGKRYQSQGAADAEAAARSALKEKVNAANR